MCRIHNEVLINGLTCVGRSSRKVSVANSDSRCAPRTLPYPRAASIRKPTRSRAAMSAAFGLGSLPLATALSGASLVATPGAETLAAPAVLTAWSERLSADAAPVSLRVPPEALPRASCLAVSAAVDDGEAAHKATPRVQAGGAPIG